jgi:hypothetical protein
MRGFFVDFAHTVGVIEEVGGIQEVEATAIVEADWGKPKNRERGNRKTQK